ncbi:Outer envelope protein 64, mitochondrial [Sarracenia purpurea var. burkii]
MSRLLREGKISVSNPKVWIVVGVGVAGILIIAETRRRRLRARKLEREDFGAFIELFELLPFPQPPPPAARQLLSGLTFAIKDIFDVKDYVTGFGNPDWKRTHEAAGKTAAVVTALLKNGATCVGKTVMDELAFGITGENMHYGTPTNPQMPSHIPGGSSSGSAVAVASGLVDFALGTDTIGCVRTPASFCGILGYRPSHGVVSTIGILPNSQSLDTVGWFARDPSIFHRVGHIILQLNRVETRRTRCFIMADDLFQLSKVPKLKTAQVVSRVTENLSGYQPPKHMNFGQYVAANVPSLRSFCEHSMNLQNGISTLKALSSVMFLLQRYEFKTNHEEWVKSIKPRLGSDVSDKVHAAITATYDNIKSLYKVRTEMRVALRSLLKAEITP